MSAVENYKPDNESILGALDIIYMTLQQAHFKGKAKSMFKKTKKATKPFTYETVPDPKTGELKKYKVYF